MPHMRFDGDFGFWAAIVAFVWIAIVIAALVLVILAIRWFLRQGSASHDGGTPAPRAPRPDDPLEILRQRYARGEIDDEEFERRKRALSG